MMTDTTQASETLAISIRGLVRRFGKTEAVHGLDLGVRPGLCYGLFGRNGAGKTTTIKCLLNHLRPTAGRVEVFGLDPRAGETAVKARIGYVPEVVAFHPWMTARDVLRYAESFRAHWNHALEADLLARFALDAGKRVPAMSKGMRAQLALLCAICPEPDLLLLDEPTSGLDPVVRREFIETVIGAYQEGGPGRRTVFVSTHLIHEFEGLIDEFTVMDAGRSILTMTADDARARMKRLRLRFAGEPPPISGEGVLRATRDGREAVVITDGSAPGLEERLRALNPEAFEAEGMTLEEIFIAAVRGRTDEGKGGQP